MEKRNIKNNVLELIGNTPIVKITKLNPNPNVNIWAKLESANPTGSVKDRIALAMVEKAEKEGKLKKGMTIIEPTSGNTGISLAMVSAVKGYKFKAVMAETMSIERRKIIKTFGAEIILVKKEEWRSGAIEFTKDLTKKNGSFMPNQFENEANVEAHYHGTGKEIIEQVPDVDIVIAGIGTGGTIVGIGKRLKEHNKNIKIIGIEPKPDTEIQGLKSTKEGYIPKILDFKKLDEEIIVKDENAFKTSQDLIKKEGIFVGISSGAALFVAQQKAKQMKKGNIIVIFPDSADRYFSTRLFQ